MTKKKKIIYNGKRFVFVLRNGGGVTRVVYGDKDSYE